METANNSFTFGNICSFITKKGEVNKTSILHKFMQSDMNKSNRKLTETAIKLVVSFATGKTEHSPENEASVIKLLANLEKFVIATKKASEPTAKTEGEKPAKQVPEKKAKVEVLALVEQVKNVKFDSVRFFIGTKHQTSVSIKVDKSGNIEQRGFSPVPTVNAIAGNKIVKSTRFESVYGSDLESYLLTELKLERIEESDVKSTKPFRDAYEKAVYGEAVENHVLAVAPTLEAREKAIDVLHNEAATLREKAKFSNKAKNLIKSDKFARKQEAIRKSKEAATRIIAQMERENALRSELVNA